MNADRRKKLNALQDLLQQTGLPAVMDNLKAIRDDFDLIDEAFSKIEGAKGMQA